MGVPVESETQLESYVHHPHVRVQMVWPTSLSARHWRSTLLLPQSFDLPVQQLEDAQSQISLRVWPEFLESEPYLPLPNKRRFVLALYESRQVIRQFCAALGRSGCPPPESSLSDLA